MTDIENEVIDSVSTGVKAIYSSAVISTDNQNFPDSFPTVFVTESNNLTYEQSLDSSGEKHSSVMYTIKIYSNSKNGRKAQCRAIMAIVDGIMLGLGFLRIQMNPIETIDSVRGIAFILTRYRAVVSKDSVIYRL